MPLITGLGSICTDTLTCGVAVSESQSRHEFLCLISITAEISPQFPQGQIYSSPKERHQDYSENFTTWTNEGGCKITLFEITMKSQLGAQQEGIRPPHN